MNDFRKDSSAFYFEQIKDLQEQISFKLNKRLCQISIDNNNKEDSFKDIESPRSLSESNVLEDEITTKIQPQRKMMKSFEDELFSRDLLCMTGEMEIENMNINHEFLSNEFDERRATELLSKIANLNLDALSEEDTKPTLKKSKLSVSQVYDKQTNGQTWRNEVILEYKSYIPGEKQTTLQIYGCDIQKLEPNTYLNDSILQLYLK